MMKLKLGNLKLILILCIASYLNAAQKLIEDPIQEEIDALIEEYNPTKERCRAVINRDIYFSDLGDTEFIFSCLLTGHRKTVMISFDQLPKDVFNKKILKGIAKKFNIKEIKDITYYDGLLYTPEGERNALLLAKYFIDYEINTYEHNAQLNDVLQGTLLGFDSKDIEFYYSFNSYREEFAGTLKKLKNKLFPKWPTEDKQKFNEFQENVWPKSKNFQLYQAHLKKAQDYLKENEKFSNKDIQNQIDELRKSLGEPIKKKTRRN